MLAVLLAEEESTDYVRQSPADAAGWLERKHVRVVKKADGPDH